MTTDTSIFDRLTYTELDEIYQALRERITDPMVDAGAYHNHAHNGTKNMVESYKAMLDYHPKFQRLFGNDENGEFIPSGITITATPTYNHNA